MYVDSYQVGDLDEALEARVTLDVDLVELDAITPRLSWLQQVVDLVAVDVYRQDGMLRLPHELLAQMGADEAAGSDHADLESWDGLAIQVQSRRHCVQMDGSCNAMQCRSPKGEERRAIPQQRRRRRLRRRRRR